MEPAAYGGVSEDAAAAAAAAGGLEEISLDLDGELLTVPELAATVGLTVSDPFTVSNETTSFVEKEDSDVPFVEGSSHVPSYLRAANKLHAGLMPVLRIELSVQRCGSPSVPSLCAR